MKNISVTLSSSFNEAVHPIDNIPEKFQLAQKIP